LAADGGLPGACLVLWQLYGRVVMPAAFRAALGQTARQRAQATVRRYVSREASLARKTAC